MLIKNAKGQVQIYLRVPGEPISTRKRTQAQINEGKTRKRIDEIKFSKEMIDRTKEVWDE